MNAPSTGAALWDAWKTQQRFPKTEIDWRNRVDGVARRFVKQTCSRCGGEDFAHLPIGRVLCRNWRPFGPPNAKQRFERQVADIVGRRPENTEALMQTLREGLR